jgi:hypothetical protein
MNFDDERRAIEARFSANYSSTQIKFDNLEFSPPANASWVALSILNGDPITASIGTTGNSSRLTRFSGIVQIDIYTPEGSGTKSSRDLADVISAIFNQVQFSAGLSGTIQCRVPSYTELGIDDGWFHAVMSVAYERTKFT